MVSPRILTLRRESWQRHVRLVVGWFSIGMAIGILVSLVFFRLAGF